MFNLVELVQSLPREKYAALDVAAQVIGDYVASNGASTTPEEDALLFNFLNRLYVKVYNERFEEFPDDDSLDRIRQIVSKIADRRLDSLVDGLFEEIDRNEGATGSAELNSEEKGYIHVRLDQVRRSIESSDLSDQKKNVLFKRLSELSKEIDLTATPTARFFGFLSELSFVSGEMAENAKPALDEFKSVLKILVRRRSEQEDAKLSAENVLMQITGDVSDD